MGDMVGLVISDRSSAPAPGVSAVGRIVAVNGTTGPLGRRIAEAIGSDADVDRVVGVERPSSLANLVDVLAGATELVVLAPGFGPDADGSATGPVDIEGARHLFGAADRVGSIRHVVVVSSAMVYGAWPNNPVPLTEQSLLRPDPACRHALGKAELERLAHEWRRRDPARTCTILRPTIVVSDDVEAVEWLERSLWTSAAVSPSTAEHPQQFLLVDDLVDAVRLVSSKRLDGAFNVAPDGWISGERRRELTGHFGSPALPSPTAGLVARVRWKLGSTSTPPEILSYLRSPWVVANDRLKAAGWSPSHTNDEAFTVCSRATWWSTLTARRRQDVALAASAVGVGGVVVGVVAAIRALRRSAARRG